MSKNQPLKYASVTATKHKIYPNQISSDTTIITTVIFFYIYFLLTITDLNYKTKYMTALS